MNLSGIDYSSVPGPTFRMRLTEIDATNAELDPPNSCWIDAPIRVPVGGTVLMERHDYDGTLHERARFMVVEVEP